MDMAVSASNSATVLVVDDALESIEILHQVLQSEYRVLFATSGPEGLLIAQQQKPDIILLDVIMPGMDGYQVCRELKANPDTREIPVIFITARDREDDEEMGFRIGGADYLGKPVRPTTVKIRIKNQLQLRNNENLILHQALYDGLTRLPNRSLSMDRLRFSMIHDQRNQAKTALLFIDLDKFKEINDTLGHDGGDQLLIEAGARLRTCVREGDTVGRLGGDEFVVILPALRQAQDAEQVAENILRVFEMPIGIAEMEVVCTTSIGVAVCPDDGTEPKQLLRNADTAMYQSKDAGRNCYHQFNQEMNQKVQRRVQIEQHLRFALNRGELSLRYQPIMDVVSRTVLGAEVLLHWDNPELGVVATDEFIGIAEHSELIDSIGAFVIEHSCRQFKAITGPHGLPLALAVNVSPQQFRHGNLVKRVARTLKETGFTADRLILEVTEGLLLSHQNSLKDILQSLRHMGVRLSMDDFGTGYSSLSYLRNFSFDMIKIDRSFISEMAHNPGDEELVTASIAMAHGLGLKVVGEGVESETQLALLATKGCDTAQGYLFSPALSLEAFKAFLLNN